MIIAWWLDILNLLTILKKIFVQIQIIPLLLLNSCTGTESTLCSICTISCYQLLDRSCWLHFIFWYLSCCFLYLIINYWYLFDVRLDWFYLNLYKMIASQIKMFTHWTWRLFKIFFQFIFLYRKIPLRKTEVPFKNYVGYPDHEDVFKPYFYRVKVLNWMPGSM